MNTVIIFIFEIVQCMYYLSGIFVQNTFAEYLYGIFLPNISTDYLYVWKYSPEYYPGTEVTNCPFNVLTAHLKCSNPFKT